MSELLTLSQDFDDLMNGRTTVEPIKCKGLFYRGSVENYIGSDGDVNFRTRLRPLKRPSCTGCQKCEWLVDHITEMFGCYNDPSNIAGIDQGALYELKVTGYSTDWESGMIDDVDVEFVKVDK